MVARAGALLWGRAAGDMSMSAAPPTMIRHDWSNEEVQALYGLPFMDLILRRPGRAPRLAPAPTPYR